MKKSIVMIMLFLSFGAFAAEDNKISYEYSYEMYKKNISSLISLTNAMRKKCLADGDNRWCLKADSMEALLRELELAKPKDHEISESDFNKYGMLFLKSVMTGMVNGLEESLRD